MSARQQIVRAVEAEAADAGLALDAGQRALVGRLALLGEAAAGGRLRRGRPRGLYVHGPAGRGKSWVADAFVRSLPAGLAARVHFHGFLDGLHRGIHDRRDDPKALEGAVDALVGGARLVLFDEFHVHDPGDARLLTRLLSRLFERGLTVLTTSNYAPGDLLPNPIWHHVVEPGIALVHMHMDVHLLEGPTDYRTLPRPERTGFAAGAWVRTPVAETDEDRVVLSVRGRGFAAIHAGHGELRMSFRQLLLAPTSAVEYLEWARDHRRWRIAGVPALDDVDREAQQRFVNLVDVLVDADVETVFTSPLGLDEFLDRASARPDAFRMSSRLRLLRTE